MSLRPQLELPPFVRCAETPVGSVPPIKHKPTKHDDRDDEGFAPDDDSDLEITGLDDEDEHLTSDTALGFDEANDDLELPEDGEGEKWITDSDDPIELPGDDDADLFPGDEYGWIGDDEPSDEGDESLDADLGDEPSASQPMRQDTGEEGVEDDSDLDELDMSLLPELDTDVEEDSSSIGDLFDELGGMSLADEPTLEVAPGEHWKILPARSVRVTTLAESPAPPTTMAVCEARLFVGAGKLWTIDLEQNELSALPLPAADTTALALSLQDGVLHLAVVVAGRVLTSSDAGRTFTTHELVEPAAQVGFTSSGQQPTVWWLSTTGVLRHLNGTSDLDGEVLGFQTDGQRRLVAWTRKKNRLSIAVSTDAGKHFGLQDAPLSVDDPGSQLAVCRGAVLLSNPAQVQCAVPPLAFDTVSVRARGPATLSNEDDEVFVYACVWRDHELLIVRRAVRDVGVVPTVVVSLGKDRGSDPQLMAASYAEGGAVTLYLALQTSLLRIDASLDGEELA